MATVEITLKHGLKIGEDNLSEAVLREPTAGDILTAQEESEKLVYAMQGGRLAPVLVTSPAKMGAEVLRRQIVRIGNLQGPLELAMLHKLHPEDLAQIQATADELDGALEAEVASREVAQRGRDDGDGGQP